MIWNTWKSSNDLCFDSSERQEVFSSYTKIEVLQFGRYFEVKASLGNWESEKYVGAVSGGKSA